MTAAIQTFSISVFIIFGRTSVQPWNTYWEDVADSSKGVKDKKKIPDQDEKEKE